MIEDDAPTRELVERATVNALVANLIYDARLKAHLTQAQLADLVGTKQPVIARLEDADYEGHSLSMLQRIAKALNRRLEIRLARCA
jgi:transcriptional regulator with XRE-family HTH domain